MTDAEAREAFLKDLALVVVTLGLYMPYWFYARNRELRDVFTDPDPVENAWLLSSGAALAAAGRFIFGWFEPATAALVASVGVVIFLAGVHVLAHNTEVGSASLGLGPTLNPWVFTGTLAAAWLGTELGNAVPSPTIRLVVIGLVLVQPFLFYRLHMDHWRVKTRALDLIS